MQTILGSGGAIGNELAKILPKYTDYVRLASRNPKQINGKEYLVKADLLSATDTELAVKDSEIVYLTAGLQYKTSVWEKAWPLIMRNVIEACKKHNSRLVFFDNIYMYDPNYLNGMTEDTPLNPSSRKGKVRKHIIDLLFKEISKGELTAVVARSADFYGPSIKNTSMLTQTILNNLAKGKKAQWIGDANKKHSFTYVPDAAEATAILGNDDNAYNQVWHLPTRKNPLTGIEWIEMAAEELKTNPKYMSISKNMLKFIGIFIPIMKEISEMYYQYDRDYVFDSSKFEEYFNYSPKEYRSGLREIINIDYK